MPVVHGRGRQRSAKRRALFFFRSGSIRTSGELGTGDRMAASGAKIWRSQPSRAVDESRAARSTGTAPVGADACHRPRAVDGGNKNRKGHRRQSLPRSSFINEQKPWFGTSDLRSCNLIAFAMKFMLPQKPFFSISSQFFQPYGYH
ncbi:hypothetical protein ZEAMMB73_Zm00001d008179 [Zea mays]|uniref:Uncharacterized protein n=1 Tax=Zea mays TaxID=4577 RepID=A0A1D6FAR2_MAIZE|nr:hypothetical protein ZEAMMB73_Zm00001d008179 [Zea mays]